MNIFLSYGHDSNTPLIEKIKEFLSIDDKGNPRHKVWIDTSEIKAGQNWRRKITEGIIESDVVLAGLSQHSTRSAVCRNEISISIGVKGGNIKTILLEPSDVVAPPAMISHIQWLDMSDWKEHENEGFDCDYFQEKFKQIAQIIETPENEQFNGEITTLKDALEPISSISRIQALTKKEMHGREWLYDKILDWDKNSNQRIFWIMAGPGFGKSTFAANLQIKYNARIPAVQFVEWGKPDHSNPCRILKNLAFQLAVRFPEYRKFILQLPDIQNKKMNEKNEDELFDLLFCESTWFKIDGGQENVWILIDALDEADEAHGNKISQTLARHIDRLPDWLRFILTSRNDSKVRLPLQKYNPQVFDLDEQVKNLHERDLLHYLQSELRDLHPSDEQLAKILYKSQGVFLYLSLCVNGILEGNYSLNELDRLPKGINGYYYEFFMRQYGDDLQVYNNDIVPILQLMVASPSLMSLPFIKHVIDIESERGFFETISRLENITRLVKETFFDKTKNKNVTLPDKITFFHTSIEKWLSDPHLSGPFYVSKKDGIHTLSKQFINWITNNSNTNNYLWTFSYGLDILVETKESLPLNMDKRKYLLLLDEMKYYGSLGGFTKEYNKGRQSAVEYCKSLLTDDKEEDFITFIIELFELTKEQFVDIKKYNPQKMFHAVQNAASIGAIINNLFDKDIMCSDDIFAIIIRILRVLVHYDSCLLDNINYYQYVLFEDLQDFSTIELSDLTDELCKKHSKTQFLEENFNKTTKLFYMALTKLYPDKYPINKDFSMQKVSFPIGRSIIHAVCQA